MMKAASKLVLLGGLLMSSVECVVSNRAADGRGLSFQHPKGPSEAPAQNDSGYYYYKSGKSSKSKGKGDKTIKDYKDGGKGLKKEKYEVHYEIAISTEHPESEDAPDESDSKTGSKIGKSSKNRPTIPEFEYIEVGYKSWKSDKSAKISPYYGMIKTSKDYGGGYYSYKNDKAYKDEKYTKQSSSKLPKAPTVSPVPTTAPGPSMSPRPTEVGSFGIGVPLYSLAYTSAKLGNNRPKTEDLKELEKATRSYLSDFFFDEFDEDDFTIFNQFITDMTDHTASPKQPVVVDFESVGRFDSLSLITPTPTQLGSAVKQAFTGMEMITYEDWLKQMLPSDNIFVGSKVQFVEDGGVVPDKTRRGIGATGIAASAVAMTLLVAGVVLYRSKSDVNNGEIDKLGKSPGDMTVAGDTFAGETYDGTVSVSAASVDYVRRHNDEEEGAKLDTLGSMLGSIPESNDVDSVKAIWSDDADESIPGRGIAPRNTKSAFRGVINSFQDVALQAPTHGSMLQGNIMPSPSDDKSQMSDSELSQFVANQTSGGNTLEIKSLLSLDSMDESTTDDLSVRDNSSRRLRTVAEIEALLSSELKDSKNNIQTNNGISRPRTVEEIETLLTEDDDETIIEEIPFSDEDESIIE